MAKHRPRAEVMYQPDRPSYGDTGIRITTESIGLTPGDPANFLIFSEFLRRSRTADIYDPDVQRSCIAAGRKAYRDMTQVVYYLRVGQYIKIGTAVNFEERLKAYPPDTEVLATERGSYRMESRRLAEFREYLVARREWFHPGPRLMAHIDTLRSAALADRR